MPFLGASGNDGASFLLKRILCGSLRMRVLSIISMPHNYGITVSCCRLFWSNRGRTTDRPTLFCFRCLAPFYLG